MASPEEHRSTETPEDGAGALPSSDATTSEDAPKPLLASEALRDDLAPVEPWRRPARIWCLVAALLFGGSVLLPHGQPESLSQAWMATLAIPALLALGAGVIPWSYSGRAALMIATALWCGLSALVGFGPAADAMAGVAEWGLLYFLAATLVPAALMFRARYRAYPGARRILAAALILAVPFVIYCGFTAASSSVPSQVAAAVAICALGTRLVGFMGSETNVGSLLAALVILAVSGQLGTEAFIAARRSAELNLVAMGVSVAAFAAAALLGAIGVFQILAVRYWRDARRVDLRRDTTERPSMKSLGDSWSTRR